MLQMFGTLLSYDDTSRVKPRSGYVTNNHLFLGTKYENLYSGNCRYPLKALNKFTTEPDGVLQILDGELVVAAGNQWRSINTVSFESAINADGDQQAVYTIQSSTENALLTTVATGNAILSQQGEDNTVNVTAINYSSGAVKSVKVNPVPGQAYRVQSTSTSEVVGELQTIGELTTACVRYDYDIANAPVLVNYSSTFLRFGTDIGATTDGNIKDYLQKVYLDFLTGVGDYDWPLTQKKLDNFTRSANSFTAVLPSGGYPQFVKSGEVFKAGNSGSHQITIYTGGGDTTTFPDYYIRTTNNDESSATAQINLIKDKDYLLYLQYTPGTLVSEIHDLSSDNKQGNLRLTVTCSVVAKFIGPIETICVQEQTTDTRETVDTRHTENKIELTLTPLN